MLRRLLAPFLVTCFAGYVKAAPASLVAKDSVGRAKFDAPVAVKEHAQEEGLDKISDEHDVKAMTMTWDLPTHDWYMSDECKTETIMSPSGKRQRCSKLNECIKALAHKTKLHYKFKSKFSVSSSNTITVYDDENGDHMNPTWANLVETSMAFTAEYLSQCTKGR